MSSGTRTESRTFQTLPTSRPRTWILCNIPFRSWMNNVKKTSIRVWNKAGTGRIAAVLVMYLSFASSWEKKKTFRDLFHASKKPEVRSHWMVKFRYWKLSCVEHGAIRTGAGLSVNRLTSLRNRGFFFKHSLFIYPHESVNRKCRFLQKDRTTSVFVPWDEWIRLDKMFYFFQLSAELHFRQGFCTSKIYLSSFAHNKEMLTKVKPINYHNIKYL